METIVVPNPSAVLPPPLPPRTSQATEWKRSEPAMRVPDGFAARFTHAHKDAVAMGFSAPLIFMAVTVSSTLYFLYRGTIWCIDKIKGWL